MVDLVELEELAAKLADVDPSLEGDESLMDAATRLQHIQDLVAVAESKLLAQLEDTAATDVAVGLVTSSWLAREAEHPKSACSRRVRQAVCVQRHFGFLAELVQAGWISWAHVEVIVGCENARNRDALVMACPDFIRWANGDFAGRFDRWATKVRRRAAELDQDGSYDPNEDLHANRLRLSPLPDDTREVKGRLVGAAAVAVTETLEQIAEELHRAFRAAREGDTSIEVPSQATLMALALEEACRRAAGRPAGTTAAPRTEAVVVIEADETGRARVSTADGTCVPDSAADALLWNADVRALLVDADGCPLWLGRKVRLASRDQRLAMDIRDGGCIFPGCDSGPKRTKAHHTHGWAEGGTTDVARMASLCGRHHGVVHRRGWSMVTDEDRPQQWVVTTADGRSLRTERAPES